MAAGLHGADPNVLEQNRVDRHAERLGSIERLQEILALEQEGLPARRDSAVGPEALVAPQQIALPIIIRLVRGHFRGHAIFTGLIASG